MSMGPFAGIKATFFDLDDTLKVSSPSREDVLLAIMGDYDIQIDEQARRAGRRFSYEYWTNTDQVEDDMDRLGPDGFWANYIHSELVAMAVLRTEPDKALVDEINRRFAEEFKPQSHVAEGTVELLTSLNKMGMIVGLVSNRPVPLQGTAERMGIYEYFHFTLAAGEIGSWKPDPGIFIRALEMGGSLAPQEAIYIGDNYFVDTLGAYDVGLKAILLDPLHAFPEAEEFAYVIESLTDLVRILDGDSTRPIATDSRA